MSARRVHLQAHTARAVGSGRTQMTFRTGRHAVYSAAMQSDGQRADDHAQTDPILTQPMSPHARCRSGLARLTGAAWTAARTAGNRGRRPRRSGGPPAPTRPAGSCAAAPPAPPAAPCPGGSPCPVTTQQRHVTVCAGHVVCVCTCYACVPRTLSRTSSTLRTQTAAFHGV